MKYISFLEKVQRPCFKVVPLAKVDYSTIGSISECATPNMVLTTMCPQFATMVVMKNIRYLGVFPLNSHVLRVEVP